MEYCPKGDLQDYIKQKRKFNKTFSEEECINIIDNVLRGLHQLNQTGMMHRDIKSANIIRKIDNGDWKICDYGLSRILPGGMRDVSQRSFTKGLGTPLYMSP